MLIQMRLGAPHRQVNTTQRRAAIASDESGGIKPLGSVSPPLGQQHTDQCLSSGPENAGCCCRTVVVQLVLMVHPWLSHNSLRYCLHASGIQKAPYCLLIK